MTKIPGLTKSSKISQIGTPKTASASTRFNLPLTNHIPAYHLHPGRCYHGCMAPKRGPTWDLDKIVTMVEQTKRRDPDQMWFAVVRNPFDWLVSYYFHNETGAYGKHFGWNNSTKKHGIKSFEDFIQKYCDPKFDWHEPVLHDSPYGMMFDRKGKCICDFAIRFEHLSEGYKVICDQMGAKPGVKHLHNNRKRKKDYRTYYTPEMRKLVEDKFANELKLFQYDFDKGILTNEPVIPTAKSLTLRCHLPKDPNKP